MNLVLVLVLVLVPNLKLSIQRNARRSLRKIGIWILGLWGNKLVKQGDDWTFAWPGQ